MTANRILGERTVLVDMDGVIADFEEPNNLVIRSHFPGVQIVLNRAEFYYKDTYKGNDSIIQKIYSENRKPGFFLTFPVIEGAIAGLMRIRDAGYNPRICTSPLEDHPTVIKEKTQWLEEHLVPSLGAKILDEAIFDRDKSTYKAIALIDDRPTVRNAENAAWQHIMFTRSYNDQIHTGLRLCGWKDKNLEQLLNATFDTYNKK